MRVRIFFQSAARADRTLLSGLCAAFLLNVPVVAQWPCSYEVTLLKGPVCPNGNDGISEKSMNEAGQPVGSWGCGFGEGFPWIGVGPPTGTVLGLPLGAMAAGAQVINDNMTNTANAAPFGQVAGVALMPNDRSFLYDENSYMILPLLQGGTASFVEGINDEPIVVGYSGNFVTGDPPITACYWIDGEIEAIIPGRSFDVNLKGQITGVIGSLNTGNAFIWHHGVLEKLPFIPGGTSSRGQAVNDKGHVAGHGIGVPPGGTEEVVQSFLWRNGEMTMLGFLPGYKSLRVHDLNDQDEIVGQTQHPLGGNQNRAFFWRNGLVIDLNDLTTSTPTIRRALSINNDGVILGNTTTTGAILTPIYGPLGDVNCDGVVGVADLLILLQNWGRSPSEGLESARCDLNEDGTVGVADLLTLLANWG